jgi:hypothetical protein
MRIYHYTSIDALALILKNRAIRFTRLDKVDDLQEAESVSNGINLGRYTFVSCWTYEGEESIPLWKMYAGKEMNGIRVSLEHDMFNRYTYKTMECSGIFTDVSGKIECFIPLEKMITRELIIAPAVNDSNAFFKNIEYTDDPETRIKETVKIYQTSTNKNFEMDLTSMGKFKHKRWNFQRECRFVIIIAPNESKNNNHKIAFDSYIQSVYENKEPPIEHYDLSLKDDAFSSLIITLSPTLSDPERIIIDSLVKSYAPQAIINESDLYGKIGK